MAFHSSVVQKRFQIVQQMNIELFYKHEVVRRLMTWYFIRVWVCMHTYTLMLICIYMCILCIHIKIWIYRDMRKKTCWFNIPSLPRDVVDLTSSDPFLLSLCLEVWISVDKKTPPNGISTAKEVRERNWNSEKTWQQLSDTEQKAPADKGQWRPIFKPLPNYTATNPIILSDKTCQVVCSEWIY